MKWKTHKVVTALAVWVLTYEPVATIFAAAGSVFPDALEFLVYGSQVPRWKHRTFSHWILPYLILLPLFFFLTSYSYFKGFYSLFHSITFSDILSLLKTFNQEGLFLKFVFYALFWFVVGAILHVLEDALTGKVPHPLSFNYRRKKWGVRLFQTGSFGEIVIFVVALILLVFSCCWNFIK